MPKTETEKKAAPEKKAAAAKPAAPLAAELEPTELVVDVDQFCQAAGLRPEHRGGFCAWLTDREPRPMVQWRAAYEKYLSSPVI